MTAGFRGARFLSLAGVTAFAVTATSPSQGPAGLGFRMHRAAPWSSCGFGIRGDLSSFYSIRSRIVLDQESQRAPSEL